MKMNKFKFLAMAAFLLIGAVSMSAQDEELDLTFQFCDKNGNVVPDGSEITAAEIDWMIPGVMFAIPTGLEVKNTSSENEYCGVEFLVEELPNGRVDCCFPVNCQTNNTVGVTKTTVVGPLTPGELKDFATEWYPQDGAYGTAKATFRLMVYDEGFNGAKLFRAYGPSVTVTFVYQDPAGINDAVSGSDVKEAGRYSLDGRTIDGKASGLNIVKMSDGTVRKVLVK